MTPSTWNSGNAWRWLFFLIVGSYGLVYAPYGINETDGGFLTGLAWQVLQGKILYHDLVYVRPPLPVWLRALELRLLPTMWAILGERWIFYLQVATYSWLAAATLTEGRYRWQLATFGFVVCTHCYPAASWHTVDGIFFAVLATWLLFKRPGLPGALLAGLALFAALLCKQSFYPLAVFGLLAACFSPQRLRAVLGMFAGFFTSMVLFINYLYQNDLISGFLRLTAGAASGGQGWQHGVVDYFKIQPLLAGLSMALLLPVVNWFWRGKNVRLAGLAWATWLVLLMGSYGFVVWRNQDFTPPFAQARLLLWLAGGYWLGQFWKIRNSQFPAPAWLPACGLLLAISWCSAVSWGYSLPILFALPGVWAILEISRQLSAHLVFERWNIRATWTSLLALAALLGIFRYGYEFVYRDGRRGAMTENMGTIFPALDGIYTDAGTAGLYRELRSLAARYGPDFKTLPAFPQANFLTGTVPPLPLDWVVAREMNTDSPLIMSALQTRKPILLIEKRYLPAIKTDSELALVCSIIDSADLLEETPHFLVLRSARLLFDSPY